MFNNKYRCPNCTEKWSSILNHDGASECPFCGAADVPPREVLHFAFPEGSARTFGPSVQV